MKIESSSRCILGISIVVNMLRIPRERMTLTQKKKNCKPILRVNYVHALSLQSCFSGVTIIHLFQPHANNLVYYLTSHKGPSEMGTTSLQRTLASTPYFSVLFDIRDRDNLSTRDKIVGPIVSLVQRFHCIL